eukprot:jgi/Mesvir1/11919/Mv00257-RA.1
MACGLGSLQKACLVVCRRPCASSSRHCPPVLHVNCVQKKQILPGTARVAWKGWGILPRSLSSVRDNDGVIVPMAMVAAVDAADEAVSLAGAALGTTALWAYDRGLDAALNLAGISCPSTVASMVFLAAVVILSPTAGDALSDLLSPSLDFVDRWLPLFYAPGVTALLQAQCPPVAEVWKGLYLCVAGYLVCLFLAAGVTKALVRLRGPLRGGADASSEDEDEDRLPAWLNAGNKALLARSATKTVMDLARMGAVAIARMVMGHHWQGKAAQAAMKTAQTLAQVSDRAQEQLMQQQAMAEAARQRAIKQDRRKDHMHMRRVWPLVALGCVAFAAVPAVFKQEILPHLQLKDWLAPLLVFATVSCFTWAERQPPSIKAWNNPVVFTGLFMGLLSAVGGTLWLPSWKHGVAVYMDGAGAAIAGLITPGLIALVFKIHAHRRLLQRQVSVIVPVCIIIPLCMLLFSSAMGGALHASLDVSKAMLGKTTTLGLALLMAEPLQASPALILAGVTIVGNIGVSSARGLLDAAKVTSPLARGIAVGASSHAGGTATLISERRSHI